MPATTAGDAGSGSLHAITWNLGGLSIDKTLTLLHNMRRGGIHPFDNDFVVFLQEVIMEPGKAQSEKDDIQLTAGKQADEWRGTAIAHNSGIVHSQTKLLRCGISCLLLWSGQRIVGIAGHLPHHATMVQTGGILDSWSTQIKDRHLGILGWDANETLTAAEPDNNLTSHSARGEYILNWIQDHHLQAPSQQLALPTHFPYNQRMQPRRLDYVLVKNLEGYDGEVLQHRDLACSDHEPVSLRLPPRTRQRTGKPLERPWGVRRMKRSDVVEDILAKNAPPQQGDPLTHIATIAVALTEPGRALPKFTETSDLKQARREALLHPPGLERRAMWKAIDREHTRQLRQWRGEMHSRAACGFWSGKRALEQRTQDRSWELNLTDHEDWRDKLTKHFQGIFQRQQRATVDRGMTLIYHKLSLACKSSTWRPFQPQELRALRKRWKNGKSCGIDMISHEALKTLAMDERWQPKLLELFNDMLYTCRIPESIERGITILLAKAKSVKDWGDTRPITLSSTLLKSFSQLILGRTAWAVERHGTLQWSRRGRQSVELILQLRRLTRVARDWGLCMYIAKLDIRKAFDSVYQEAMAEQIAADVGETARMPWEARAWITLLRAGKITISFRDETFTLEQTNGVRQGSPDSPIAFGRVVSKDLEEAIQAARGDKPSGGNPPPQDGGSYMDDTYIWSTSRSHLQRMLNELCQRLPPRGLQVHPGKTEIIANQSEGEDFVISGNKVKSKGPEHIIPVLGSPLSFSGEPAMLIAEMQQRGRNAFWAHRGILLADAPLKRRMQNHVILVRQAALWSCQTWPCTEYVLRSANTLQALQIRRMLKQRRGATEPWLDWHKRSLRLTRVQIHRCKIERWSTFILEQIWSLYGHVARGDVATASMLSWRGMKWWRAQQAIPVSWGGERHAHRFNPMMDTERHIVEVAGLDWQTKAQDRATWIYLGDQFVAKYDVPWSSGEQLGLDNLDTNRRRPTKDRGNDRALALRSATRSHR